MDSISVLSTESSFLPSTVQGSSKPSSSLQDENNHLVPLLNPEWAASSTSEEPLTSVACCYTMDGQIRVVVGSHDKSVLLYDGKTGKMLDKMGEHKGIISAVTIATARSGGGLLIASVSGSTSDRRVRVLKGIKFRASGHVGFATLLPRKALLEGKDPPRELGEFSDGDSRTAHSVDLYKSNQRAIERGLSVASGGKTALTKDSDETEDLDTPDNPYGAGGGEFGHRGAVTCLTFVHLNDGTLIVVTGGTDKTIRVWNESENGQLWCVLEGHTMVVRSISCLVTSNPPPPQHHCYLDDPPAPYVGGCLRIASASNDEKILLWDGDDGVWMKTLEGHKDKVTGVCLLDTKWGVETLVAISVSYDRTIKIWDASMGGDGVCLLTIGGGAHIPSVQALAYAIIADPFAATTSEGSDTESGGGGGGASINKEEEASHHTMFKKKDKHSRKHHQHHHHQQQHSSLSSPLSPSSISNSSEQTQEVSMRQRIDNNLLRIRIVVGFRGKALKVWDCLGSPTSGFHETVIGSEIDMPEPISDVTMSTKGDRIYVALKNGKLHCFKCLLKKNDENNKSTTLSPYSKHHHPSHRSPSSDSNKLKVKHHIMSPNEIEENEDEEEDDDDDIRHGGGGGHHRHHHHHHKEHHKHHHHKHHHHKGSKFQNRKKEEIEARASIASSSSSCSSGSTFPAISQGVSRHSGKGGVGKGERAIMGGKGKGNRSKPPPPPP